MSNLGRTALLLSLAFLGGTRPAGAQTRVLSIEVYDYSGLGQKSMHQFLERIRSIFSESAGPGASEGLAVQMAVCETASRGRSCERSGEGLTSVQIRILPGPTRGSLLGEAFVGSAGGTYATVFLRPVQEQAAEAGVPWTVVLAYAAAHEIGHLLLGRDSHSPRGLMKAKWDRQDYQSMNQNACHFTKEQWQRLAMPGLTLSAGLSFSIY